MSGSGRVAASACCGRVLVALDHRDAARRRLDPEVRGACALRMRRRGLQREAEGCQPRTCAASPARKISIARPSLGGISAPPRLAPAPPPPRGRLLWRRGARSPSRARQRRRCGGAATARAPPAARSAWGCLPPGRRRQTSGRRGECAGRWTGQPKSPPPPATSPPRSFPPAAPPRPPPPPPQPCASAAPSAASLAARGSPEWRGKCGTETAPARRRGGGTTPRQRRAAPPRSTTRRASGAACGGLIS